MDSEGILFIYLFSRSTFLWLISSIWTRNNSIKMGVVSSMLTPPHPHENEMIQPNGYSDPWAYNGFIFSSRRQLVFNCSDVHKLRATLTGIKMHDRKCRKPLGERHGLICIHTSKRQGRRWFIVYASSQHEARFQRHSNKLTFELIFSPFYANVVWCNGSNKTK